MSNTRLPKEVKSTKSLLIDSMSCEEKAAHIQSEAAHALEKNSHMDIGYRYLQSRSGRISTFRESLFAGFFAVLEFLDLYKTPSPVTACAFLFYIANVFPNISNNLCYRKTEDACAEWLQKKFDEKEFKQIQNMSYNKEGLNSLSMFLGNKKIAIEKKREDVEIIQNSFISFTVAYFKPELTLLMFAYEIVRVMMKKMDVHQTHDNQRNVRRF